MPWSPILFGMVFLAVSGVALASALVQLAMGSQRGMVEVAALMGFAAVFGAIGGLFLRSGLKQRDLERRLRRDGTPADATVTAVAQGKFIVNDAPQWVIRYRFADHRGVLHEGASVELPASDVERWRPGDVGRVLFNRQNPRENLWLGASDE
jgi:hypothetical protein